MAIESKNDQFNMTPEEGFGCLSLAGLYVGVIRSFVEDGKLTEHEVGERLDKLGRDFFLTQEWKRSARRRGIPENMRVAAATIALQEARPFLFGEQKPPREFAEVEEWEKWRAERTVDNG